MWKWLQTKKAAWGEALVFLAVGGLATYLKPEIGVPILLILLLVGLYLILRAYGQVEGKEIQFSRREQAHKELANLIELGQELWEAKELIPDGQDPFEKEGIQKILAKIQRERNLPENSRIRDLALDEKLDALISIYMKFIEFDFPHDPEILGYLNDAYTKIRQYINQRIKD